MMKSELGLVDKMIFEIYKDKVINSSSYFKKKVKSDYGYIPSSDLYREIINYQVKKYGKQLFIENRQWEKLFYEKNRKSRKSNVERVIKRYKDNAILERLENEKRQSRGNTSS